MYASSVGKLLEGSSVTGCRVSKYHVNRVNSGTFPAKIPLTICSVDATETFSNVLLRNDSGSEQDVLDFCAVWTAFTLLPLLISKHMLLPFMQYY